MYARMLAADPVNPDALHFSAVLLQQRGACACACGCVLLMCGSTLAGADVAGWVGVMPRAWFHHALTCQGGRALAVPLVSLVPPPGLHLEAIARMVESIRLASQHPQCVAFVATPSPHLHCWWFLLVAGGVDCCMRVLCVCVSVCLHLDSLLTVKDTLPVPGTPTPTPSNTTFAKWWNALWMRGNAQPMPIQTTLSRCTLADGVCV